MGKVIKVVRVCDRIVKFRLVLQGNNYLYLFSTSRPAKWTKGLFLWHTFEGYIKDKWQWLYLHNWWLQWAYWAAPKCLLGSAWWPWKWRRNKVARALWCKWPNDLQHQLQKTSHSLDNLTMLSQINYILIRKLDSWLLIDAKSFLGEECTP